MVSDLNIGLGHIVNKLLSNTISGGSHLDKMACCCWSRTARGSGARFHLPLEWEEGDGECHSICWVEE